MTTNHEHTPENLRPIESAIDALGQAERAAAPDRLEQGVFLASYRQLTGAAAPVVVTRPVYFGIGLRMAAVVALVGALVGLWVFSGSTPGTLLAANGLEDDVNFLLDLRSSADEMAILGERIDSLYLDTTTVRDALSSDPASLLLGDGAL